MNIHNEILSNINIVNVLKEITNNNIKLPILDDYNSLEAYWYPHPPCLIPLFLGYGASYKGIVHHFFCNRKNTFIEYNLEFPYFYEIARNEKQLLTWMILSMIAIKNGVTDEIIQFCNETGYKELNAVDTFSIKYGDNPKEFDKLIYFRNELPSQYVDDITQYNGDYPSSMRGVNKTQISNACAYEVTTEDLHNLDSIPLWLDEKENKKNLFEKYILKNQLKEAWFTLNSKGWLLTDVAEALCLLKTKSNDKLLHLIADNWISNWKKSDFKENTCY